MILHGYWRSGASYRVRIALALKGVGYDLAAHDLRKGEQKTPDYLALNPQGMVPALQDGDRVLIQSPAILEWLEEVHPDPARALSDGPNMVPLSKIESVLRQVAVLNGVVQKELGFCSLDWAENPS